MHLLSEASSNAKTAKNDASKYLSYILHLSPYNLSGVNLCPKASKGCVAACLNSAGRGAFSNVQTARLRKSKLFITQREEFMRQLSEDLERAVRRATKAGLKAVVRLNGTSDVDWTLVPLVRKGTKCVNAFEAFPEIQFYDYTKVLRRLLRPLPTNYHLTFSRSESNENDVLKAVEAGFNVAVVFSNELPLEYLGRPVRSGEDTDLRFLDDKGIVVGLVAKGKARRETLGFVVR